jgi:hypothetical protein
MISGRTVGFVAESGTRDHGIRLRHSTFNGYVSHDKRSDKKQ